MRLENTEGTGVDLGVVAQLRQVAADQREVVLFVELTQASNALNGRLVADLATDGVGRVRWINDYPALADDFDRLC